MTNLILILKLLPVIVSAVQSVEMAIPLPSAGKAKLDLVLGTVSDVYASTQQLGQELPLDRLTAMISQVVARIVATFNALGLFKKA